MQERFWKTMVVLRGTIPTPPPNDPARRLPNHEFSDPWRCHYEVFNAIMGDWIQSGTNTLRANVPSLNLYPSFQIVFNVSFVSLCLIIIFELYACGVATGFVFNVSILRIFIFEFYACGVATGFMFYFLIC
jgi:hypothetical protein